MIVMTKVVFPIVDGTRKCIRCGIIKSIGEFYRRVRKHTHKFDTNGTLMAECKECFRRRMVSRRTATDQKSVQNRENIVKS